VEGEPPNPPKPVLAAGLLPNPPNPPVAEVFVLLDPNGEELVVVFPAPNPPKPPDALFVVLLPNNPPVVPVLVVDVLPPKRPVPPDGFWPKVEFVFEPNALPLLFWPNSPVPLLDDPPLNDPNPARFAVEPNIVCLPRAPQLEQSEASVFKRTRLVSRLTFS
jgi:hypothetical protein